MTTFKADVGFLAHEGLTPLYGEPVIFHCNYYNISLQRTIEDAGAYIPAPEILTRGAVVTAYAMFRRLFETHAEIREPQDRLQVASDLYAHLGFGLLPLAHLSDEGGVVKTPVTHYSFAWSSHWGTRETPVDYFSCGYIQAALAISFFKPPGYFKVEQIRCLSLGNDENEFVATPTGEFSNIPASPGLGVTIKDPSGVTPIPTHVDENGITNAVRGIPLVGNADGLIPAFGVYLTRHFANYYNFITYEAAKAITEATGEPELAKDLFIEASHMCTFYTFGGIMESDEWYGLVVPQCQTKEDWISGLIAITNAFGWGYWTVTELDPGKRMVLHVDGNYESNGYLGMYGKSSIPRGYLVTGAVAGLMNLFYFGDITQKPELNKAYYNELFGNDGSFLGQQVKCRSMGDDYCEVVTTKSL